MKNNSNYCVIGASSQLGQSLRKIRPDWNYLDEGRLDLSNLNSLKEFVGSPVILNFAAFTAVDDAEKRRNEAATINNHAVGELAARCDHFIHISTDYVFSGKKLSPYKEDDPTAPLSYYGQTKLDGERTALRTNKNSTIVRTSWLYSEYNKNFVKRMLELAQTRDQLRIVNDQLGTPTFAGDLARVLVQMAEQPKRFAGQIYHYSNQGQCSWYDFTREIFRLKNIRTPVHAIPTSEYPTPAVRPPYSVLDKSKIVAAADISIPNWQTSLAQFLEKYPVTASPAAPMASV